MTPDHVLDVLCKAYGEEAVAQEGYHTDGHHVLKEEDVACAFKAESTLLYGELLPSGCSEAWQALSLLGHGNDDGPGEGDGKKTTAPGKKLFELGMGTGKVALQAFLECPSLQSVVGVELAPSRFASTNRTSQENHTLGGEE